MDLLSVLEIDRGVGCGEDVDVDIAALALLVVASEGDGVGGLFGEGRRHGRDGVGHLEEEREGLEGVGEGGRNCVKLGDGQEGKPTPASSRALDQAAQSEIGNPTSSSIYAAKSSRMGGGGWPGEGGASIGWPAS